MTIRSGLDVQPRPLALSSPGWKTASGGLKPVPRRRLCRFTSQPTGAPWKNRLHYDFVRRGSVLPQKDKFDPVANCKFRAVASGIGNGLLDLAGLILGEAVAAVVIRLGVTAIQGTNAITGTDKAGGALTVSGSGTELAGAATSGQNVGSLGKAIARGVPYLGWGITAVSLGKDYTDAKQAYQSCGKGN
jgi:hypothetical protein